MRYFASEAPSCGRVQATSPGAVLPLSLGAGRSLPAQAYAGPRSADIVPPPRPGPSDLKSSPPNATPGDVIPAQDVVPPEPRVSTKIVWPRDYAPVPMPPDIRPHVLTEVIPPPKPVPPAPVFDPATVVSTRVILPSNPYRPSVAPPLWSFATQRGGRYG
jgi:hypothetical protein